MNTCLIQLIPQLNPSSPTTNIFAYLLLEDTILGLPRLLRRVNTCTWVDATRGATRMFDEEVLRSIMMTCIILHNIILVDEYDYDASEVFEPDPMNTALTRIYERPMGPNGHLLEHDPLVRDGRFNNPMLDCYQEMQSSYVQEKCQVDLIEHLWEMKGNHNE
ncbi:unnamed protein product [Prunus armeniaca]